VGPNEIQDNRRRHPVGHAGLGTRLEATSRRGCDHVGGNTKVTQHKDVEMNPPGNGVEHIVQGNGMEDTQEKGTTDKLPPPLPQTRRKRQD
jgi:hypothetical protein